MRDGQLVAALVCMALGIALGFTPTRVWMSAVVALAIAALSATGILTHPAIDPAWANAIFMGCWISIAGVASTAYLPHPIGIFAGLTLSLHAGALCGALAAVAGSPAEVLTGLPAVFVLWIVRWAGHRNATVAVKVVSSWLIAVALLAATLQVLPVTPGYLPDHVE